MEAVTISGFTFNPIPERLIRRFEPQADWIASDNYLHGVGHLTRVFILQELISQQLVKDGIKLDRLALRWAACTHDVGRQGDGIDPLHGQLSANWMNENLHGKMPPETLDTATYIVHWHVPSDDQAPVMTPELQVLKDTDALDRVRLGDLNTSYLRTYAAHRLVELAEQLYAASLSKDTHKPETFEDVLKAALTLGIAG